MGSLRRRGPIIARGWGACNRQPLPRKRSAAAAPSLTLRAPPQPTAWGSQFHDASVEPARPTRDNPLSPAGPAMNSKLFNLPFLILWVVLGVGMVLRDWWMPDELRKRISDENAQLVMLVA